MILLTIYIFFFGKKNHLYIHGESIIISLYVSLLMIKKKYNHIYNYFVEINIKLSLNHSDSFFCFFNS